MLCCALRHQARYQWCSVTVVSCCFVCGVSRNSVKYTDSLCVCTWTQSSQRGLIQFQTVCIPWFLKLPVCHECENSVFLKTLVGLGVLAPVCRSFQNWQFLTQSAKLLPKIETPWVMSGTPTQCWFGQPQSQWLGSSDQVELHNTFVEPSGHQGHDQGALQHHDIHTQWQLWLRSMKN